ncbi:hypothetical protein QJS10_CPB19g00101 [Acorus calamus]|uniref:VQ domain-containing protein n=1 Tax=Acorus calamus TaxID=4465 RepID=A0AAV9CF16_ACOCL|nr:hypothetical protein QJS10_CPB19g00101 [Acorus calamus]
MEKPVDSKPITTFVQADATTFRELVQRLTGPEPSKNMAVTPPKAPGSGNGKRPAFKLHERRQYSKSSKLMIVRPSVTTSPSPTVLSPSTPGYTTSPLITPTGIANLTIFDGDRVGFELNSEEEEKAIRERRFYLHPSPRSRPGEGEPELLHLFPLTSPKRTLS